MDRIKAMDTFVRVAKLGSYTRAALELQVTPAMVSKRILLLESELNVRLLYRNTHQLSLTGAGQEYLQGCSRILSDIRELNNFVIDKQRSAKGNLKILCSKAFAESILAEVIADFFRANEGVTVSLTIRDMSPKAEDVLLEGFDLSIRTRAYAESSESNLVMRKIVPLARVLVASPAYIAAHGEPLHPADLATHNCLNPNGLTHDKWTFSKGKSSCQISVSGTLHANSGLVVRTACAKGLGIGLLSRYTVEPLLEAGSLTTVLSAYEVSPHALYVYYNKTRYLPNRTRAFIDFLTVWMKKRGRQMSV